MKTEITHYKIRSASENDIKVHLLKCDPNFLPILSLRVDINTYSKKIFNHAITFEAWQENKLIGLVACYCNEADQTGFITNVSVYKEFTGKGIAGQLIKMCFDHAFGLGYKAIRLEVNKENKYAVDLYKRYEFKQIGSSKNDLITMERFINNKLH